MAKLYYLESGIICVTISAKDTLADIEGFSQARMDDLKGKDSIWDFNLFDVSVLDTDSLNSYIVDTLPINNPRAGDKAAHFAESDLVFALLRMYQQLRNDRGSVDMGVFRTEKEALSCILDP